ncbi:hypothetical protein EJ05DRAFT_464717 [Pseudovirgaria hyperparasitica]|uniref:Polyprenal reductase n=1 Tax=Pseudovirgaria hyperparasitica TaxID=470096 RepID=A0A6A6W737_9PEZI|nr:uncharacterized protein EJ05DRAFT_464717 [Pseudovirgaria hyperparasitica]KAF2757834.1 hypothetical protein EJ05DRAFT_464717 [Pseudovirgaria hyperparasitica]
MADPAPRRVNVLPLGIDPAIAIRAAFLAGSAFVLLVYAIPLLRNRLLAYGPRSSVVPPIDASSNRANHYIAILDRLAAYRVPHNYFTHFYIVSVVGSLVWAQQLLTQGSIFNNIAQHASLSSRRPAMSFESIVLAWMLLCVQGSRRLYESLVFSRSSKSTMWVGHWALGLLFYVGIGLAIWIEGIPTMIQEERFHHLQHDKQMSGAGRSITYVITPSGRNVVFIPLFLLASGLQYVTHKYLYSLPRYPGSSVVYTRPTHPTFSMSVTPHYFFEVLIYTSLTILSAPRGNVVNWTVACGLVFVTVNLGVTAIGTRQFWICTWGQESVRGKANMIPLIW